MKPCLNAFSQYIQCISIIVLKYGKDIILCCIVLYCHPSEIATFILLLLNYLLALKRA
jgi:hypothetical protein